MKIIDLEDFERKDLFLHFNSRTNPFSFVTVKVDITNIIDYCKVYKNYYASIAYIITKTANEIDNFKYRYIDNKIVYYDKLNVNITQKIDNDIGFFVVPYQNDFKSYIKEFVNIQDDFNNHRYKKENSQDEVWCSCEPWFEFLSVIPPFSNDITIPQFIWSKFYKEDNKTYTNLLIMIHHGFADGSHIGLYIEKLNKNIENFNNIVKEK